MGEELRRRLRVALAGVLLVIVAAGTLNLLLDAPERWLSLHVVLEILTYATALGMAVALWRGWWRAERTVAEMRASLQARRAERDVWRASARRALEGLSRAIDDQFDAWGLTPAEREVAFHLLKGYSHKAIARNTDRAERTVRQHAVVVYQKAQLSGRAELAAYFLEDLVLPRGAPPGRGEDASGSAGDRRLGPDARRGPAKPEPGRGHGVEGRKARQRSG